MLFQQFTTGHSCYWLLNSGSGDMVKGIKYSLFFRFLICHPRKYSFSTSFAVLKLRFRDGIRQKHFGICHLYGMIFCFEIENTDLRGLLQSRQFFCCQGFMQKMTIKMWTLYVFLKHSFCNHLPLPSYDIVCCSLSILKLLREISFLYFLDFSCVASSSN